MAEIASNELKFEPDMYFYVFYQILEDLCKNFKIEQFMAEKLSFSVFFASRNLRHFSTKKMLKNASNELKFGLEMYFYLFDQILEDF